MECLVCYTGLISPHSDEDICERCLLWYSENIVCDDGE